MSAKTNTKPQDEYIYSPYDQLEWDTSADDYIYTAEDHPDFRSSTIKLPQVDINAGLNPDVSKEIEQFKNEYGRWASWYAYYYNISPPPGIEALKYIKSGGKRGFVCLDWELATYQWAKEAVKRYKYIGAPDERIWYLENFVTVPVSGGGQIILDPFLIGTPAPRIPW
jgi:hypothetical protein